MSHVHDVIYVIVYKNQVTMEEEEALASTTTTESVIVEKVSYNMSHIHDVFYIIVSLNSDSPYPAGSHVRKPGPNNNMD